MPRNKEKTIVKFLKRCDKYNPGEIAGFTPKVSASLIKRDVAELYVPETPQEIADMAAAQAEAAQATADKAAKDATAAQAEAKKEERLARAAEDEKKKDAEAVAAQKKNAKDGGK